MEMKMNYLQPASQWVEALPQGNGRLGVMSFGGVEEERLTLNEDTLWSGYPGDHIIPDSFLHVQKAEKLILEGKAEEAQRELEAHLLGDWSESYEPLGELLLSFPDFTGQAVSCYQRNLNLLDGVSEVSFTAGETPCRRTLFVSHPHQVFCLKMNAGNPIPLARVHLSSLLRSQTAAEGSEIILTVRCPSCALPSYYRTGPEAVTYDDAPEKTGISATAVLRVDTDGRIVRDGSGLRLEQFTWFELRLASRSNFESFDRFPGLSAVDHAALARHDLDAAGDLTFEELLREHREDFSALMSLQEIRLDGDSREDLPTDRRLRRYSAGEKDDSLPVLLYQFGRYLLLSASRPGTQAMNLQGIWSADLQPIWSSNYTTNINTEMNYWPAEICNLPGCSQPLFDLVDKLSVTGGKVAGELFRARGATTNHNTDLWGHATPVGMHGRGNAVFGWWPMAYGWLSAHLFEHFIYTGDRAFLRDRALPVLRNAALFFIDTVSEDDEGCLTLRPATSPENTFLLNGECLSVSSASTMTDEIIREVMTEYLTSLEILGLSEEDAPAARRVLEKLPPLRFGADGRLLEWAVDYEESDPQHRHISPVYGLFPGHLRTVDSDPRILEGIRKLLARRGDGGTGWSLGWKVNVQARLHDGDHALKLLRRQLQVVETSEMDLHNGGGTYLNLFCAHPPYQIDGNMAASSGVPRLLIDSALDEITLLPALPSSWKNLTARGLRGANGYTVDLRVRDGKLTDVKLVSGCNRPTRVRVGNREQVLTLAPGETRLATEKTLNSDLLFPEKDQ